MKRLLLFLPLLLLFGCNVSEDCVKSSGSMRTKDFAATPFNKVYVYPNISLVIKMGDDYSITAKAGSNIIDDISVEIKNGSLELRDNSGCNLSRQYGNKTVYITTPHLPEFEIYSNTGQKISSDGTITHDIFRLYAMDYFGGVGTGDFTVDVNNNQLVVQSNNISIFKVTGQTQQMLLDFYDDLSRFEGADFLANDIKIFQRSANDMIIHPVQSLSGDIYSTGNVLCKTHPAEVNVVKHYIGRLIYVE
ncbi:MAG: DUF2807 domain-containing protein [Flavobacterium sp.]|nr:MAG: DUF2807 domain-containing protein [Flavobacterium sp.]